MYAEVSETASKEKIPAEMLTEMRKILAEKGLDFVQFYVNFTEQILPDPKTGKKQLIRTVESEADHEYDIAG